MTYVKGTNLWHAVRSVNGGIRTLCGRAFPLDTPTSDTVVALFFCGQCRKMTLASGDGRG